jgi:hypothetical protein
LPAEIQDFDFTNSACFNFHIVSLPPLIEKTVRICFAIRGIKKPHNPYD